MFQKKERITCPECHGIGKKWDSKADAAFTCKRCKGRKTIRVLKRKGT